MAQDKKNKKINILALVSCIGLCLAAGSVGSIFTSSSVDSWYSTINKPSFNPPNWIFGPVWTTLFIMMGVSLYMIWSEGTKKKEVRQAMSVFGMQFVLNILWSLFFFGLESPLLGLIDILFLWLTILLNIFLFYRISKKAGILLMPYLAWVSFAAVLNFAIFLIN